MKDRTRLKAAVLVACLLIVSMVGPLASLASANHAGRTLDVEPEGQSHAPGETHTFTATLSSPVGVGSGTVNIDFENEAGINDADGVTLVVPDLTCSIPADATSCTVSYVGNAAGRDIWRAWIDHDGVDATVEADRTEGRNHTVTPGGGGDNCPGAGTGGEPDCTDVVDVTWGNAALDCDDAAGTNTEQNTNPGGGGAISNEPYACTLTDAAGRPANDVVINAEVENGVNDPDAADGASYDSPDYSCRTGTGANGTTAGACTINITQNENELGTADICFWRGTAADGAALCADEPVEEAQAADGSDVGNDLADKVQKTWETRGAAGGGIDAEPEGNKNPLGAQHTVTVTVYDQFGAAFAGTTAVNFEFFSGSPSDADGNSPTTPDATCTTSGSSTCAFTYSQANTPGTDLICAWANAVPVMAGTNNAGTCDAEGRVDEDDEGGAADPPAPRADDVDVVQKVWQLTTSAARLDCAPETAALRRNTSNTITCTATDQAGIPVTRSEIDAEALSANDPDAADSPTAPDFGCVTGTDGTCSFVHGPAGQGTTEVVGQTVYRVWIDADNDNSTTEADAAEGRDETVVPGATEPDSTDLVEANWGQVRCDIVGTAGNDRLTGTPGDDVICGFGGNDTISGSTGGDTIFGDSGNDKVTAGNGHDTVSGGKGDDTLAGLKGNDTLKGGPGNDKLYGGDGADTCSGGPGRDIEGSC